MGFLKRFRGKPKNKEEYIKREREADAERRRKAGLVEPTFKPFDPSAGEIKKTATSPIPSVTNVSNDPFQDTAPKDVLPSQTSNKLRRKEKFRQAEERLSRYADKLVGGAQSVRHGYERVDKTTKRIKQESDLIGLKVNELNRKEGVENLPLGGSVSLDFGGGEKAKNVKRKGRAFNNEQPRPMGGSVDLGAMSAGLDRDFGRAFGWRAPKRKKKKGFSYF